ncbi:MAG: glycosyltransferase family 4 protein [Ruminococcus sp.]|nr:glycosyltransferase family 4 protein [Ruminococcus sp.]MBR3668319.1 glycosyltransferase family 4 protein [Ruminococcus sp.]
MKRILVLANSSSGAFQFRKELFQALIAKGYSVALSNPDHEKTKELKKIGCKTITTNMERRGANPLKDIQLFMDYVRLIKKERADIVLTYTIKPNVYGGFACQVTGTPYITNVTGLGTAIENGGIMQLLTTNLYKLGLRRAACVFFQNSNNRRFFMERKLIRAKTRLIPGSGVNTAFHKYEEFPDEKDGVRFLFVGRIMKDKGIEELLSAFDVIHREYPLVSLDIVGSFDEDYSSSLDKAVCEGYVRYHGSQDDVHSFYKNTHCVVLPSYHEGMSNVLLEGASTGRPVITTFVPGCKETFEEGKTGFGCKVRSSESLIGALRAFIALSNEEKAAMGKAGRKKVVKEFERSIIVKAYLNEIEKITEKESVHHVHRPV